MPKTSKVAKVGIKKEDGYLYFVDKDGDISKVKMNRGGKKKTTKKKAAKKTAKKAVRKTTKKS
ncbi:MAG: hypothetical protein ACOCQX_01965, partial [Candidatus Nanoarchaeia archaeon]